MGLDPAEYAAQINTTSSGDGGQANLSPTASAMAEAMGLTDAERVALGANLATSAPDEDRTDDEGPPLTDREIRSLARFRATTFDEKQRADLGTLEEALAMLSPELQAQHARALERCRSTAGLTPTQARMATTRGLSPEAFAADLGITPRAETPGRPPAAIAHTGFDVAGALGVQRAALDAITTPT